MTTTDKQPLLTPIMRWFMFAMVLANIAGSMFPILLPIYLTELGASIGQVGIVFTRRLPLRERRVEAAPDDQLVPLLVDPPPEPVPLAEQRLVGHLHRRCARHGIGIEGEEPVGSEAPESLLQCDVVEVECAQFGATHSAAHAGTVLIHQFCTFSLGYAYTQVQFIPAGSAKRGLRNE